jgi:uncharacterized Zn-binding protein involved in type VI secretion
MPPVSTIGGVCSGHDCYPPRATLAGGASTVFINGQPAALAGATLGPHACGLSVHVGAVAGGSSTVFVESRALARIADPVTCGSVLAQGSPNVFAGG